MRLALSVALAALAAVPAFAADLPARKGAPAAPQAASSSCLETSGLPIDVFGFTTGSDVSDVGSWGATVAANSNFTTRATRLSGLSGVAQLSGGLFRCFEVGPYAFVGGTRAKDRFGDGGTTTAQGGGVELKYKLLGRGVHGVGATLDVDFSGQNTRFGGILGTGSISAYNLAARLFLDREIVADRLFGALNFEHISSFSSAAGVNLDASQFNARAALSAKIAPNFYIGAEALYSRTYTGAGYKSYLGDGFFVGPNMLWAINDKWTLNAAWQVQVAGKSRGNPGDLNLVSYNQHLARVKLGYAF